MESKMTIDFRGRLHITADPDLLESIMDTIVEAINGCNDDGSFDICVDDFNSECVDSR